MDTHATHSPSYRLAGRLLGLLVAAMLAWILGLGMHPAAASAAESTMWPIAVRPIPTQQTPGGDALGGLGAKLENLAKSIARIATPIAIFCIVLVLLMYLFAPLLPDIAQQNKGYIMRALAIVALIGLVPEIVKFASGLTG